MEEATALEAENRDAIGDDRSIEEVMPYAPRTLNPRRAKRVERRPNSSERGYNERWKRFRLAWLQDQFAKGNVRCGECGKVLDGQSSDIHVDHIVDHKGDYERFWDESNLQALHKRCHSVKTARENGFRKGER